MIRNAVNSLRDACVLVTGATGFIGSHLVERLLSEHATVRCLLRPVTPRAGRILPPSGVKPVLGDLTTGVGLEEAIDGADVVFHLAGVTKAPHASEYYAGNAQATENLVRAMSNGRATLIHMS